MGIVICAGRGSRCVKGKCVGGTGGRRVRIRNSREVPSRDKEGVWWRRGGISEGSGVKKAGAGGRTMKEFIQEFKRAARGGGYKGRLLIEEFKRGMNRMIRRKLMEAKNQPGSIKQWYRKAITLDRNWRESK